MSRFTVTSSNIASPTIRSTPGGVSFARLELDKRLEIDYADATRFANRNLNSEKIVGRNGLSVEESMERILKSHPIHIPKDEMEMDYMRANAIATNNQQDLVRSAKGLGLSVEDFMDQEGMLTDTHLTPWAR